MKRRPITEKPKQYKGLTWLLIILMISGFMVSVYLFGLEALKEIIHP